MKKKIVSFFLMILISSICTVSFADENKKVIVISMNRTNLENMLKIQTLNDKLKSSGYIALMNIRGDGGCDDRRSYASIGAGSRASVASPNYINFLNATDENIEIYESATGKTAKEIIDITINKSLNINEQKGEYGSTLGLLGNTLSNNEKKIAVIGNSDKIQDSNLVKNRNICLMAMDEYGRVELGNIDDINKEDDFFPFGISTDYQKLSLETDKYYESADVLFIELGDTYRLDEYKKYLNEETYLSMQEIIYKNIDAYLTKVFSMVNEKDVVYVVSPFVSNEDYNNTRQLSPVIKFSGDNKGILKTNTTRRNGVVANIDIAADILNEFDLENENLVGRSFTNIDKEENIKYILNDYEKIVSTSKIRTLIMSTMIGIVLISSIIAIILLTFKQRIEKADLILKFIKEPIKLGIVIPFVFLFVPILNLKTTISIQIGVFLTTIILYILGKFLFRDDDIEFMRFFAVLTIILLVIDSLTGTNLMKNNIMSYDSLIGARYYGIGNEYEGVIIGCALFALASTLQFKNIPKICTILMLCIVLITTAYPSMGANVGGAISECVAYLLFIFLLLDLKIDLKKVLCIGLITFLVVMTFAILDLIIGTESHLALFIKQILLNGPVAIIQTFTRKIKMNLDIINSSIGLNTLILIMFVVGVIIFKPSKNLKALLDKYKIISKGFIASLVGAVVTLLVNDSGIVAALTASIYILIPLLIMSINQDKRLY